MFTATQREILELRTENKRLQGEVTTLRIQLADAKCSACPSPPPSRSNISNDYCASNRVGALEHQPMLQEVVLPSGGVVPSSAAPKEIPSAPTPCELQSAAIRPSAPIMPQTGPPAPPYALEVLISAAESPVKMSSYSYVLEGGQNAKEDTGACMLCLEALPNDPREVVNLCSALPMRCLCLLHKRCFLNPRYEMNDQLRRCMICKSASDPNLVRQAVKARQKR